MHMANKYVNLSRLQQGHTEGLLACTLSNYYYNSNGMGTVGSQPKIIPIPRCLVPLVLQKAKPSEKSSRPLKAQKPQKWATLERKDSFPNVKPRILHTISENGVLNFHSLEEETLGKNQASGYLTRKKNNKHRRVVKRATTMDNRHTKSCARLQSKNEQKRVIIMKPCVSGLSKCIPSVTAGSFFRSMVG